MRINRVLLAAAASVMALALTGCGSGDGGSKVPTAASEGAAASGSSTGGGSGDDVAAYVAAQGKYVKCLRENGIDAPDPDAQGNIDFGGGDNLRALKKNPKFKTASVACDEYLTAVPESVEKGNQPALTAAQIKVKQEYATCMQKNGAADFPDPGADGLGQGEWDQTSAGAKRATRICGPIVGVPATAAPGKG
ncbi:hypothetical protein GCM10023084_54640 [Streptomyces lacrimifluminis]|uniref:Lipoprotein n=1 Tax=Streptomyces lacrimifluminis TaxID=1500077 RepID=A0A917KX26_9ACTN|nr:hypothetical protein [Streptomyces lacrimifluminis]GGJ33888.1 hypothetical protein GCM10012282_33220 [Streptomyces lacrimifluminis]